MAKPRIITARSIGLSFRSNRSTMGPETSVVGHYSATPRARDWRAGVASARSFHRSHQNQGWAGIGYHYLISDDGAIIGCRPVIWNGAHVLNANANRVGVNMPGTTGDRPTRRQARAFNWLLHNAHTPAMPARHRTDNDLSKLPIFGHRDLPGQDTACPGLFKGMYTRGGDPWRDEGRRFAPDADDFVSLAPEDEDFQDLEPQAAAEDDEQATGPDEAEARADAGAADEGELPEADDEYDEDLSDVIAEIEQARAR